jgi:putative SOS response-associated peptidase YedK
MCYYNGIRVTRAELFRLKNIERQIRQIKVVRAVQSGFLYGSWPVVLPVNSGLDYELQDAHWEYIPPFIYDEEQLQASRKMTTWLNAKSENLFVNEKGKPSMYKEGALNGRCLVLSSGFVEWQHVPIRGKKGQILKATEKIPYYITLKNIEAGTESEYFYMAGVSRIWTNRSRNQSAPTFAICTTEGNDTMKQIHNTKFRMPTILTEDLAYEWLTGKLSPERIQEIAQYRIQSSEMKVWTISKSFLTDENPLAEVVYPHVPKIVP